VTSSDTHDCDPCNPQQLWACLALFPKLNGDICRQMQIFMLTVFYVPAEGVGIS